MLKIFTNDPAIYSNLKKHEKVKTPGYQPFPTKICKSENYVNNAENTHSLIRPYLNIMFKGVSKKNLNTYIKFFQFTYNNGTKWL